MRRYGSQAAALATPLNDPDDADPLLDRVGDARIVMLGEATHGTHEFYRWRADLTRRLIGERGFSFVAVEGDWPDCDRVDRAVRGRAGAPDDPRQALTAFERWPTWMWANDEVADFCRWLRDHNAGRDAPARVGFHGLDVYSLWDSMREILLYLSEHEPDQVPAAHEAYRCFEPYGEDPQLYGLAARLVPAGCEDAVVDLLTRLRRRADEQDGDDRLAAWQNAEVVAGAERYYRAMVAGSGQSWNLRDRHMDDTLARLLEHYGPDSKAVVWAHNTHVGDGRATDMAAAGMVTIGQLARERHGAEQVVLVGFGTHRGTVVAGESWGAPPEAMQVPPARHGSLEDVLHAAVPDQALLVFPRSDRPEVLTDELRHRAIGVVYRPKRERRGNYVPTVLGDRYDAFCWFDRTRALTPLAALAVDVLEPETYPSGV